MVVGEAESASMDKNKLSVDGGGQAASWTYCILDLVSGCVDLTPAGNLYVHQHRNNIFQMTAEICIYLYLFQVIINKI